ncbi:MAG: sensor histidine kinase [Proteobacteria bacterium]|nr:sensor histidine kinase [Pseudomonadota bacterium]
MVSHSWCVVTKRLPALKSAPKSGDQEARGHESAQLPLGFNAAADCYVVSHPGDSDSILQEIHHRVRNNLQLVLSLLNLQLSTLSSVESRAALEESAQRIRTLSKAQDLFYHDRSGTRFDVGPRLLKFFDQPIIAASQGQERRLIVTVQLRGTPVLMAAEDAIPFCMALSELVSVAARHGGTIVGANSLEVIVHGNDKDFSVLVSGRPLEALRELVAHDALELRFVRAFAAQCSATLNLQDLELLRVSIDGKLKDFLGGD